MMRSAIFVFFTFCFCAHAFDITPAIQNPAAQNNADAQMGTIVQALKPGYTGYLGAGLSFTPLPSQVRLTDKWGTHKGYPFRQRLGAWFAGEVDQTDYQIGWLGFAERNGWGTEDFLVFPPHGEFDFMSQIYTTGLTYSNPQHGWLIAGGIQFVKGEREHLDWWLLHAWGPLTVAPVIHRFTLRSARIALNLQKRKLRPGTPLAVSEYAPDLEGVWRTSKDWELALEQNLYGQHLYAFGHFWNHPQNSFAAGLRFYPDASRLLLRLELAYTHPPKEQGRASKGFVGGSLELPFLRLAYNSPQDYRNFFGAKGYFAIELKLSLNSAGDQIFGLGGTQNAPMEKSEP
jgi:hypothetical protein